MNNFVKDVDGFFNCRHMVDGEAAAAVILAMRQQLGRDAGNLAEVSGKSNLSDWSD